MRSNTTMEDRNKQLFDINNVIYTDVDFVYYSKEKLERESLFYEVAISASSQN